MADDFRVDARAASVIAPGARAKRKGKARVAPKTLVEEDGSQQAPQLDLTNLTSAVLQGNLDVNVLLKAKTDKGIDALRVDLMNVDHRAGEELKRLVHDHYTELMGASQAILKLDSEMSSLRKAINGNAATVQALRQMSEQPIRMAGGGAALGGVVDLGGGRGNRLSLLSASSAALLWADGPSGQQWYGLLDGLDTAIGERRVGAALEAHSQAVVLAEQLAAQESRVEDAQARHERMTSELEARVAQLIPVLERLVKDPTATREEMRGMTSALQQVSGTVPAHAALLDAHSARLRRQQQMLIKPQHAGGADSEGAEYASAMSQKMFLGIADALEDAQLCFGDNAPELSALLLSWTAAEAANACAQLRQHAIDQFSGPAGVAATVRVVLTAMAYTAALETSHSMRLSSCVWRELWPSLEQVLTRHVRRLCEDLKAAVDKDVCTMATQGQNFGGSDVDTWEALTCVFPHLRALSDELRVLTLHLVPLAGPNLGSFMRKAVSELFMVYTKSMRSAMSNYTNADGSIPDDMGPGLELLLEGATLLIERILPSLLAPISAVVGDVIDISHLGSLLDSTAEAFGLVEAA